MRSRQVLLSKIILGVVALLVLISGYGLLRLKFSANLERYFPPEDTDFQFYRDHSRIFDEGKEILLVGIKHGSPVMDHKVLSKLRRFSDWVSDLEYTESLNSLTTLHFPLRTPTGFQMVPYVHPDDPSRRVLDSIRISKSDHVQGTYISRDFLHSAIYLETTGTLTFEETGILKNQIISKARDLDFDEIHLLGRSFSIHRISERIRNEMILFAGLAAIVIVMILAFLFGTIRDIILPLSIITVSALILLGLMGLLGMPIDLLSSVLPVVIFVIGIADVIHINTHYRELRKEGYEHIPSVQQAIRVVGLANFLTSITTAIGFLTLLTSDVPSVRQFAIFSAVGIMIAFLMSMLMFPAILIIIPPKNISRVQNPSMLRAIFPMIIRKRLWIVVSAIIVTGFGIFCGTQLKVDNYLSNDLPKNDPIRKSYDFFSLHFGGPRLMDLNITFQDAKEHVMDFGHLRSLQQVEELLKREYQAGSIFSPMTIVEITHQAMHGGSVAQLKMPPDEASFRTLLPWLTRISPSMVTPVLDRPSGTMRVVARIPDFGGHEMEKKNQKFLSVLTLSFPDMEVKLTGIPHLMDVYNRRIAMDMVQALSIAIIVIGLLMGALFRDIRWLLVAILVNIVPLFAVVIIIWVSDIYLSIPVVIIFSIAFGICVDDSIHLLVRTKLEMSKGRTVLLALRKAYSSTGKAVIFTSIVLMGGFGGMIFSDFGSTYYFGLLIGCAVLMALLADLLLLPVLVAGISSRKK